MLALFLIFLGSTGACAYALWDGGVGLWLGTVLVLYVIAGGWATLLYFVRLVLARPRLVLSAAGLGVPKISDDFAIRWGEIEAVAVLHVKKHKTTGLRVMDPRWVDPDLARAVTGSLGFLDTDVAHGLHNLLFLKRADPDDPPPAGRRLMAHNRERYGYDILFGPDLRDRSPGQFADLLDRYCISVTGRSIMAGPDKSRSEES